MSNSKDNRAGHAREPYGWVEEKNGSAGGKGMAANYSDQARDPFHESDKPKIGFLMVCSGIIALSLYLASHYNYLLFHTTAELFCIAVGWALFALVWNARRWMKDHYFFTLGVALASAGCIDFVHTLAYKGMNIFPGYGGADLPTQLWIAARYLQSLSMLLAVLLFKSGSIAGDGQDNNRETWEYSIVTFYIAVTALALALIFLRRFPVCYIEGQGLSPFKKISEYLISLILLVSLILLWRKRSYFDHILLRLLLTATIATILSELAFTFYVGVYDFSNLVGHYGKLAAFYLIYLAVVRAGLQRPYGVLFRNLNLQAEALRESETRYSLTIAAVNDGLWDWHVLSGETFFSRLYYAMLGYENKEFPASYASWRALVHPEDLARVEQDLQQRTGNDQNFAIDLRMKMKSGAWRWVCMRGKAVEWDMEGKALRMVGTLSDITERKQIEEELRTSALTHRALVESIPDIVIRFDQKGRHLFVSENVVEMTDIPAGAFMGRTHRDLGFPEEQCLYWEKAIKEVFNNSEPFETEFAFEGMKGRKVFNWRLIPELDGSGKVQSVLSLARDITSHRRVEQDYRTLFQEMLNGFALHEMIYDLQEQPIDYRFLTVNPAFEHMTGLSAQEVVGKTVLEIMPGIERYWIDTYGKVAMTGEPVFFENYTKELNKHFEVTAFRPAPNQFACIFADITQRKLAEEKLRRSEERNRAMVAAIPDLLFRFDENFRFIDAHAGLPEQLLLPMERFIGKTIFEVLPVELSDLTEKMIRKTIATGEMYTYEYELNLPDGKHYYESRITACGRGEAMSIVRDITKLKLTDQEKEKLQAQLIQAQKMESVGRLAGGVAHDFNNMLMVIIGNAETAMEKVDPATSLYENLQEIFASARRSADLTRQLLAFARKQTIAPRQLDLNEIISNMIKMLLKLIGEDIELVWKPTANLWPVKMDPSQIDQILVNLAVNARDAITGVGNLTIETENIVFDETYCMTHAGILPGEYVLLAVSDTGSGMEKETLEHLFEPFFTTKEVGKGTGLGLATIFGIVKQNEGFINVYSEPGQGSIFKIYIPKTQANEETATKETSRRPVRGTETVLLVEDEPAILKLGQTILERYGYTVLAANTPGEAKAFAEQHQGPIHLLITDVVMPQMNGRDLWEKIAVIRPGMKTLYMSGYSVNAIAHHGVLEKDIHFLQKPFSVQALIAKVRKVLDDFNGN